MAELPFHIYDVFTGTRFAGNPLAIVEQADHLTTEAMQTLAREFNLSETIFIRTAEQPGHDASVRIFTPGGELPFAGHPVVGCAIHLASGSGADRVTLECQAGTVSLDITKRGDMPFARFTAPLIPERLTDIDPGATLAAAALGLDADEIGFGGHTVLAARAGPAFVYVPLATRDALARAKPTGPAWQELQALTAIPEIYCYTPGEPGSAIAYHARMFAPDIGIPEDPATGSATAILSAALLAAGELAEGGNRFSLEQGADMGRPSQLELEIDKAGDSLAAVRVAGSAVPVSRGFIKIE